MFQKLIDQSSDAIYVTDGTAGRILYVNDQACQDLGYTRDELLRMKVMDIDPRFRDDAALQQQCIQDLRFKRQVRLESEHRRRDGSTFPVELSIKAVVHQDQNFGVVIARDITERHQAEEALRQSEERFREAFESANVGMCLVSPGGCFLKANTALTEMLGYTEEELRTKTVNDVTLPEDHHISRDYQCRVYAGETSQARFEKRYQHKSGRIVWVQVSSSLLRDDRGEPLHFVAHIVDITERVRMDALLEERQHFLQQIVDTEPGTVYIYDLVKHRNIFINHHWLTAYGYTPEETEAMGSDLYRQIFHPDELACLEAHHQAWRQAEDGETRDIEYRVRTKDGEWRWLHSQETAFARDEAGRVTQILGIAHDITDQRRTEQALQESEARFRDLFDGISDLICVHDLDGRVLVVNPAVCQISGYTADEIVGRRMTDFLLPEYRSQFDDLYLPQIKEKGRFDGVFKAKDKDGKVHYLEYKNALVTTEGREPFISGVGRDITERRHLWAQLLQAQKMEAVGRLAGSVAHDFNNLLTIITGYGELLLQKLGPDDPGHKEIEEMTNAGVKAGALTRQLLAFSRRQILKPRVLKINPVFSDLENMLRRLIGEDIELRVKLDPAAGKVNVDPGQLEQVILNLVVNARDAMPQGGRLTIETGPMMLDSDYIGHELDVQPGPYVMLAISDNGTGMDDEVRSQIFEPFFTTKGAGKGTGLGLSTVFGIVKQSGGDIGVYSELGHGTTFRIYLPRTDADESDAVAPRKTAEGASGTETILLVEDEDGLRKFVNRVLEEKGYRVLAAASGPEALTLLELHQGPVHLLLTDVIMPGMSGKELADRVQARRPDIKIIFTSGYTDDAIAHHGVLEPDYKFISKPIPVGDLTRTVREVLDD